MTTTYSKTALVRDVAASLGFNQTSVADILDAALAQVTAQADAGATVNFPGFGRFQVKTRAARSARNPRTGEVIPVPEKRQLAFTPTKPKV